MGLGNPGTCEQLLDITGSRWQGGEKSANECHCLSNLSSGAGARGIL